MNLLYQCTLNRLTPVSAREAVLVTGAGTGLGEATALRLAQSGYTVFAAVRRAEDGEALKRQAGSAAHRVLPVLMDLMQQESVNAAVAAVQQQLDSGRLVFRALINSVGPMTVVGAMEVVSTQQLEDSAALNVSGTLRVTQAFLPLLRATAARGERARLIFTSSLSGTIMTVPFFAVHGCNKGAVEGLANAFRMELRGFVIDVCIVTPGAMSNVDRKTRVVAQQIPSMEQLTARFPRVGGGVLATYDRQLRSMATQLGIGAAPVEDAAVANEYCIRVWQPEARYFCSWDGVVASAIIAKLPEPIRDRMLLSMAKPKQI